MRFTNQQPKTSHHHLAPVKETRRRSSVSFLGDDTDCHTVTARAAVRVENTYQLAPTEKLNGKVVESIIEEVLNEQMAHVTHYDPEACKGHVTTISDILRNRLKERLANRYRLVCLVNITQLNNQGVQMVSRCLWSTEYDQYWSYEYKTNQLCVVVTVYAVYLE